MKKLLSFIALFLALYLTACQREASLPSEDHGTAGNDSTPAGLLIKTVSQWSNNGVPFGDSIITEYAYNSAGKLISQQSPGDSPTVYHRDALQRITKIATVQSGGETIYLNVFYTGASSSHIAYTLNGKSPGTLLDSMAYTYTGDHVQSISWYVYNNGVPQFSGYRTIAFDTQGNVSSMDNYGADSTHNIRYTFEYDNKPNPYYSPGDDVRLYLEWGYVCSPNNTVKQNNQIETGTPSDYVSYAYTYNSNNKPVTMLHSGPAIGNNHNQVHFYYK